MDNQIIDDILASALDGGITYWCRSAHVVNTWPAGAECASDTVSRGATLLLAVIGDNPVELNREAFEKGIRAQAKARGLTLERFYDEHDAADADNAVQLAVFQEVRYG